jgi:hypothetical protein
MARRIEQRRSTTMYKNISMMMMLDDRAARNTRTYSEHVK